MLLGCGVDVNPLIPHSIQKGEYMMAIRRQVRWAKGFYVIWAVVVMVVVSVGRADSSVDDYIMPEDNQKLVFRLDEQEVVVLGWDDSSVDDYIMPEDNQKLVFRLDEQGVVVVLGWDDSSVDDYIMPEDNQKLIFRLDEQDVMHLSFNTEEARNVWRELEGRKIK